MYELRDGPNNQQIPKASKPTDQPVNGSEPRQSRRADHPINESQQRQSRRIIQSANPDSIETDGSPNQRSQTASKPTDGSTNQRTPVACEEPPDSIKLDGPINQRIPTGQSWRTDQPINNPNSLKTDGLANQRIPNASKPTSGPTNQRIPTRSTSQLVTGALVRRRERYIGGTDTVYRIGYVFGGNISLQPFPTFTAFQRSTIKNEAETERKTVKVETSAAGSKWVAFKITSYRI